MERQATERAMRDALDQISMNAAQLESLVCILLYASKSEELPERHFENACCLACVLATEISAAAKTIAATN